MSDHRWVLGFGAGAVMMIAGSVAAQDARLHFSELVAAADTIVVGEMIDTWPERMPGRSSGMVATRVTLRVHETLKGVSQVVLPVELQTGPAGFGPSEVFGLPMFAIGERAVLFLSSEQSERRIVEEPQGYFPITTAPDGTEHITLHDRRAFSNVTEIGAPIMVSTLPIPTMSLVAFRRELDHLLGRVRAPRASPVRAPTDTLSTTDQIVGLPDIHGLYISFPPRDQTFNFFQALEDEYRSGLGREQSNEGFVDAEGSAVWFSEWLRYVLNLCTPNDAATRVLMQIRGEGIQPVCADAPTGVINFPPRDQSLRFLSLLDDFYRDELWRNATLSYVDLEGKAVWLQEYLRYRVNGCGDTWSIDRVLQQIRGDGIAPLCGPETFPFRLSAGATGSVAVGEVTAAAGPVEVRLDFTGDFVILACVGPSSYCIPMGGRPLTGTFNIPDDFPPGPIQAKVYFNSNFKQPPGDAVGTVTFTYITP